MSPHNRASSDVPDGKQWTERGRERSGAQDRDIRRDSLEDRTRAGWNMVKGWVTDQFWVPEARAKKPQWTNPTSRPGRPGEWRAEEKDASGRGEKKSKKGPKSKWGTKGKPDWVRELDERKREEQLAADEREAEKQKREEREAKKAKKEQVKTAPKKPADLVPLPVPGQPAQFVAIENFAISAGSFLGGKTYVIRCEAGAAGEFKYLLETVGSPKKPVVISESDAKFLLFEHHHLMVRLEESVPEAQKEKPKPVATEAAQPWTGAEDRLSARRAREKAWNDAHLEYAPPVVPAKEQPVMEAPTPEQEPGSESETVGTIPDKPTEAELLMALPPDERLLHALNSHIDLYEANTALQLAAAQGLNRDQLLAAAKAFEDRVHEIYGRESRLSQELLTQMLKQMGFIPGGSPQIIAYLPAGHPLVEGIRRTSLEIARRAAERAKLAAARPEVAAIPHAAPVRQATETVVEIARNPAPETDK